MESKEIKAKLVDTVFGSYGVYNVMGFEMSDKRGYLTFTCGKGTFVAVLAKGAEEVWFYKLEERRKVIENED